MTKTKIIRTHTDRLLDGTKLTHKMRGIIIPAATCTCKGLCKGRCRGGGAA